MNTCRIFGFDLACGATVGSRKAVGVCFPSQVAAVLAYNKERQVFDQSPTFLGVLIDGRDVAGLFCPLVTSRWIVHGEPPWGLELAIDVKHR